MNPPESEFSPVRKYTALRVLLIAVSIGFAYIVWPFSGAILWGVILAILFAPLYRRLLRPMRRRRSLAAIAALMVILLMVFLPLSWIAASLVHEGASVYQRIQSGELNFGRYFEQIVAALPAWARHLLEGYGLGDLNALQKRIAAGSKEASSFIAGHVFNIGQSAFDFFLNAFVMLYLLFFLLRDGATISQKVRSAIPLSEEHKRALLDKFTAVVRATVKGNILIAALQGTLGGLAFWALGVQGPLLWGVVMAFASLLPAIGAAIVWLPVAIYFLATGDLWHGVALTLFGMIVLGLSDNFLRPIVVGNDIKMPDYLVLISTLGGIAVFGFNGFVIGPVIAAMFLAVWDIFGTAMGDQ